MTRTLRIPIVAGETTCASQPGVFCRFLYSRKFGTVPVCALFRDESGSEKELQQADGWTQRLTECIEAERGEP